MIPGVETKIGGKTYVLPPLSIGMLELYQDRIDAFQSGEVNSKSWSTVIDVVHAALKQNYPDMKREEIADGLHLRDIGKLFAALMSVSGVEESEPGK